MHGVQNVGRLVRLVARARAAKLLVVHERPRHGRIVAADEAVAAPVAQADDLEGARRRIEQQQASCIERCKRIGR